MRNLLMCLLTALVLVITFTHNAQADPSVVIVSPPAHLEDATRRALEAWKIPLRSVNSPVPSAEMPGASDSAKSLCEAWGARALVWITVNDDGPALWVYDRDDDRVAVRRLSIAPPFDEASAASVALTIKTLLMHSATAPQESRFGATKPPDAMGGNAPAPLRVAGDAHWFAEGSLHARHSVADDQSLELRMTMALSRSWAQWQIGTAATVGPGRSVEGETFRGHFTDLALSLWVRRPLQFGRWRLSPELSGALHATKISGSLLANNRGVVDRRFNPSLGVGFIVSRRFKRVALGIGVRSNLFLRSQRYLVADRAVLDLPTADVEVGAYLSVPLL
jgi:hypothetical protein